MADPMCGIAIPKVPTYINCRTMITLGPVGIGVMCHHLATAGSATGGRVVNKGIVCWKGVIGSTACFGFLGSSHLHAFSPTAGGFRRSPYCIMSEDSTM